MRRRRFLAVTGTAVFSGCVTGPDGSERTPTRTDPQGSTSTPAPTPTAQPAGTPTRAPTETPPPLDPIVKLANPIYRWTGYTDAVSNDVSGVGRGATLPVASRFKIWFHDGTLSYDLQVRAFEDGGEQVGYQSYSNQQSTDMTGFNNWEAFVTFDTTSWDRGRYEGEFMVRDTILDESSLGGASDSIAWTVDVVDPLQDGEAVLADRNIPENVNVDEHFEYSLTFKNTTSRDSSIVSTVSTRVDGGDWRELGRENSYNLPAGEAIEYPFSARFSEPGRYEYRLDTVGITWEITVTEA